MDLENTWIVIADAGMKSAVLCAAGLLVAGGLMRGTSAARRHIVYAGVLIACLLLPAMSLLLPQWRILPPWPGSVSQVPTPITTAIEISPVMPAIAPERAMSVVAMSQELAIAATPAPEPIRPAWYAQLTLTQWLTLVWLSGTALFLLPLLFGQFAILRIRRSARSMNAAHSFISPHCRMPMACGLLRPAIILPADAQAWPAGRRDAVIRHESEHLRRRDCLWQQLGQFARALYWFNPLIWLAHQRMLCEAERACDDAVLVEGSSKPSDYAEHLLAIATSGRSQLFVASAAVAMARSNSLEGRLLSILDSARSRRAVTRGLVYLCIALFFCVAAPLAMLRAQATASATQSASGITTSHSIGLYVVTKPADVQHAAETALADLELAAVPMFSEGDIRAYEWPTHTIHLRPGVTDSIRRLGERPFMLVVDGQRIYHGALRSVNDFSGPTIYIGLSDTNWPPHNAFVIERSTAQGSPDVRTSVLLKQALLDLKLLQERRGPVPDLRPAATRSAAPAGRLDFRVAVTLNAAGGLRIPLQQMQTLLRELLWQGPEELSKTSRDLIWVETDVVEPSVVSGVYQKKRYFLLSNSPEHTMLYDGTWGLTSAFATTNEMARPAVGFTFDDAGAAKFKELTSTHLKHVMACVLDGKVVSIPTIQSVISRSGIISANEMTEEEAAGIIDTLNARIRTSAPAATRPSAATSAIRAMDAQQQAEDWVSNFFSTIPHITAFRALEFGKAETLANGNSRLRARIEGEIRGQDRFVQDGLFEFAPDGRLASMHVLKPTGGPPLGIDLTLNPASKPSKYPVIEVQPSADPVFNWMPPPDAEVAYMGFFVAPIPTPEVATLPQQQLWQVLNDTGKMAWCVLGFPASNPNAQSRVIQYGVAPKADGAMFATPARELREGFYLVTLSGYQGAYRPQEGRQPVVSGHCVLKVGNPKEPAKPDYSKLTPEQMQAKVQEWVEDFFSANYRDVTARKTIEWGKAEKLENGNWQIRYKYEAEIRRKDKILQDKLFTFTPEGAFVSVQEAAAAENR